MEKKPDEPDLRKLPPVYLLSDGDLNLISLPLTVSPDWGVPGELAPVSAAGN